MANKSSSNWMPKLSYGRPDAGAHAALLATVFGTAQGAYGPDPAWIPSGFRDQAGRCVACIETALLGLVVDGAVSGLGAIRLVAVHPEWRGKGLFRHLMTHALAWCDAHSSGPTLLYTEEPDLYRRFGFRNVTQHAFCGPAPPPVGRAAFRSVSRHADAAFIRSRLDTRSAVSNRCAIVGAPSLFFEALGRDTAIAVAYLEDLDTLVAYEADEATLVLVDVVAAAIPSLGAILGALGRPFETVRTLFPPDTLDWSGEPVPDDTGLMLRGPLPAAMTRPFMLPPTTEF